MRKHRLRCRNSSQATAELPTAPGIGQLDRAIAGRDPIEASFLVSKHLHMMFRNQTEVLDQYPEHFETSKLRQPAKKGQVYFGSFYLGKCNKARLRYNGAGPWSL